MQTIPVDRLSLGIFGQSKPVGIGRIDVHRFVDWATPADPHLLEFLVNCRDRHGNYAILRPASISDNIPYSREHVGNRCRALAEHGILDRVGHGRYRLTELGGKVARGELSDEELAEL